MSRTPDAEKTHNPNDTMLTIKQTFPTPKEHTPGLNTCEFAVVHHTATGEGTIKGVLDGLYRRDDYASCHYCIDTNGDLYQIGDDNDILWHAGVSSWNGRSKWDSLNSFSIGIEVIGPLADGGFTDAQRKTLKELLQFLMDKHGIPLENILRHKDIAPKRKTDIADTLWNGQFKTWDDYKKSLITPLQIMTDYIAILAQERAKPENNGVAPLFSTLSGDQPLDEKNTKALLEIAALRILARVKNAK